MGTTGRVLVLAFVSICFTACGNNVFESRKRQAAPRGPGDVGVLIEKASEEEVASLLSAHPQAQVRILSREHGIYEIFGVAKADVESQIKSPVSSNKFFQFIKPASGGMLSFPAPEGMEVDGLKTCRAGRPGPTAILTVTEPAIALNGATIEIGKSLKINSLSSHADASSPGPLTTALVILAPETSAGGMQIQIANQTEFTPDVMGLYQIFAVVQDGRDACAMDGMTFIVTGNKPYLGNSAPNLDLDIAQMRHLDQVSAKESWTMSQGDGVTIAVIDSGVNYNHPALAPNMAVNPTEIPGNNVDDDQNGFVDDVVGYDFVNDDAFPFDDDGHGSHVSGLAAGRKFGMAQQAKILAIKGLSGLGGDIGTIAASLRYAVDNGAQIVNMSLGAPAPLPHPALVRAMEYAESHNVLVIVSSGNGDPQTGLGFSIDETPFFPATMTNDNILTVGAFDKDNILSTYSNFGVKNVDVLAPGGFMPLDPMFSATLENPRNIGFVGMNGTSMAAPVVAGIAAQVWSYLPRLGVAELKELLMAAGEINPELSEVVASSRHINAFKALQAAEAKNALF